MTNIKLITVCSHPEHAEALRRSAELHNWDFVCIHVPEWKGFGMKLIETYNYLKAHPEVERFVFCDAFDVVVFGTPEEFEEKHIWHDNMLLSCERGLWPPILHPFKERYIEYKHRFNYINSGLYYSPSGTFISLVEKYKPSFDTDDQYWMNMVYLFEGMDLNIMEDSCQRVFNSHSFIDEGQYGYDGGRIQIMNCEPVFVHSNGRSVDPKLDELVKEMLG